MRELFGRLIELDPAASEDVMVIDYFDRLIAARIGIDALLREGALLGRAAVGYEAGGRRLRYLASGATAGATPRPPTAIVAPLAGDGQVWMDVVPSSAPSAAMVLERLALALALTRGAAEAEPHEPSAVELLLSPPAPGETPHARLAAMGRLRLEPTGEFRAVSLPLTETPPAWPSAVIDTPRGPVRGVIARSGFAWLRPGGIGTAAEGDQLHVSWRHALLALRLSDGAEPFEADELGPLLLALETPETDPLRRREVERLRTVLDQHWSVAELGAVADGRSLRQIAAESGLHHSTVQSKLARLPLLLGYDPSTPIGRHRLALAILLLRLSLRSPSDRPTL